MDAAEATPLGGLLLARGAVDQTALASAIETQQRQGGRLGDILVAQGALGWLQLYQAIAEHHQLPFVDLLKRPPETVLVQAREIDDYIRLRALPWQQTDGTVIIATSEPTPQLAVWASRRFGGDIALVITSPFDIRRTIEQLFAPVLTDESRMKLYRIAPERSARETFTTDQRFGFALLAAIIIAWFSTGPARAAASLILFFHLLYAATMAFKWLVFARGAHAPKPALADSALAMPEHTLPVYTILVPLYREAASLPHLLANLERLDYPRALLDIKLILEADDKETLAAAHMLKPARSFDIITVPPSEPRTKPKACNYALRFARGEFVTIYDAEDRPEPLQLKKAVAMFRRYPQVSCLQARLNYYNANQSLLTRWFALEYAILFDFLLPGLQRLGIPIPLGGTSNHFRYKVLKEAGEWDPFNVTEDADLGVRLAALSHPARMLGSITLEEAPVSVHAWLRQRSRWIKGYMQTWLVHMRHPYRLWKEIGTKGLLGFQFFVGIPCLTFLSAPIIWLLSFAALFEGSGVHQHLPGWFPVLAFCNLVAYLVLHWFQAKGAARRFRKDPVPFTVAAIVFPVYWFLHSAASYKSLWQLIFRPHFWEKTEHGVALGAVPHARPVSSLFSGRKPIDTARANG